MTLLNTYFDFAQSEHTLDKMVHSIVHDIKSPAIAISGLISLLEKQCGTALDEKGKIYCTSIKKAAKQVEKLTNELLWYSDAKNRQYCVDYYSLKDIIANVYFQLSQGVYAQNIDFRMPDRLPSILCDQQAMTRIFKNLIDNALKYGGDTLTEICIEYEEQPNEHCLTIRDNGGGMPLEEVETALEPFMRCTSSSGTDGSGLGLSIVKELVQAHKGHLDIRSRPHEGVCVRFSISKHLERTTHSHKTRYRLF